MSSELLNALGRAQVLSAALAFSSQNLVTAAATTGHPVIRVASSVAQKHFTIDAKPRCIVAPNQPYTAGNAVRFIV